MTFNRRFGIQKTGCEAFARHTGVEGAARTSTTERFEHKIHRTVSTWHKLKSVCAIHGITVFLVLMIFGMWSNTPSAMPVMPQACHRPTIPQETSKKMMMTFFWTLVKTGFLYHYVQPKEKFLTHTPHEFTVNYEPCFHLVELKP